MCENQNFEQWVLGIFRFLIKEKENRKQSNPWKTNMTFSVKEKKGKRD